MWLEATLKALCNQITETYPEYCVSTSSHLKCHRSGEDMTFDCCGFEIEAMTSVSFYFPDSSTWIFTEKAQK